jgi:hypothetical protein
MGYFPNGTAGDMYEAKWCARCVHHEDDPEKPGCPVMLAHVLYAYEECNSQSNAKHILDELIPIDEDGWNKQCAMFVTVEDLTRKRRERRASARSAGNLPGVD